MDAPDHLTVSEGSVRPVELNDHGQLETRFGSRAQNANFYPYSARSIDLQKLFDRVIRDLDAYSAQLGVLAIAFGGVCEEPIQLAQKGLWRDDLICHSEDRLPIFELSAALSIFGTTVRNVIDNTVISGDFARAHICIGILHDIDEQLMAVESLLRPK